MFLTGNPAKPHVQGASAIGAAVRQSVGQTMAEDVSPHLRYRQGSRLPHFRPRQDDDRHSPELIRPARPPAGCTTVPSGSKENFSRTNGGYSFWNASSGHESGAEVPATVDVDDLAAGVGGFGNGIFSRALAWRSAQQPTPSSALIYVLGRFGVGEKTSRQHSLARIVAIDEGSIVAICARGMSGEQCCGSLAARAA